MLAFHKNEIIQSRLADLVNNSNDAEDKKAGIFLIGRFFESFFFKFECFRNFRIIYENFMSNSFIVARFVSK